MPYCDRLQVRPVVASLLLLALVGACKPKTTSGSPDGGSHNPGDGGEAVDAGPPPPATVFGATLSGAQQIPVVDGTPEGSATVTLSGDKTRVSVKIKVDVPNLSSLAVSLHFGAPGETGPEIVSLGQLSETGDATTLLDSPSIAAQLDGGQLYLDVRDGQHPAGFMRGQVLRPGEKLYVAVLDGMLSDPPVMTAVTARGYFVASPGTGRLRFAFSTSANVKRLALLKQGSSNTLIELTDPLEPTAGPTITGRKDDVITTTFEALSEGALVVSMTTTDATPVTVTGPVTTPGALVLATTLSGTEVVPPVATTATGAAMFVLNYARDSLIYALTTTTTPTTLELHEGGVGGSGDSVYSTPGQPTGLTFGQMPIRPESRGQLVSGGTYLQINNAAHATGELRGQIHLPGESVYTASLTGGQVVPPTPSADTATATLLLSADKTHLRYYVASPAQITDAYFERAIAGGDGLDALHLSAPSTGTSGTVFAGVTALTALQAAALASHHLRLTLATAANPRGDLAGQVTAPAEKVYSARLTSAANVPATGPIAGQGAAMTIVDATQANATVIAIGPQGMTASTGDVRRGSAGASTPAPLFSLVSTTGGEISASTPLNAQSLADLARGLWYVNVSGIRSATNTTGTVRGQIVNPGETVFAATLSGSNVLPSGVITAATGSVGLILSTDQKTLRYDGALTGVTPTTASLFLGTVNELGSVIVRLTIGADGQPSGSYVPSNGQAIDGGILTALSTVAAFVQVQSAAHPDGELRGPILLQ